MEKLGRFHGLIQTQTALNENPGAQNAGLNANEFFAAGLNKHKAGFDGRNCGCAKKEGNGSTLV